MKISELTGAELDVAVGLSLGLDVEIDGSRCIRNLPYDPICGAGDFVGYSPSTDWSQGGPIIEREWIDIQYDYPDDPWADDAWLAFARYEGKIRGGMWFGPTPLIAAMRAFVASKK